MAYLAYNYISSGDKLTTNGSNQTIFNTPTNTNTIIAQFNIWTTTDCHVDIYNSSGKITTYYIPAYNTIPIVSLANPLPVTSVKIQENLTTYIFWGQTR